MNTAFEPEPLWVTGVWLALSYLVVWLAFRLPPVRAFLATVGMVITSTIVVIASEPLLPTPFELPYMMLLSITAQTALEAAFLVWGFRVAWSRRFALLFVANGVGMTLSVAVQASNDIERAVQAQMVPIGATRAEVLEKAPRPDLERPFDTVRDICPVGTARALEYYGPTGVIARFFPIEDRSSWGASGTTICLDVMDRVVDTQFWVN